MAAGISKTPPKTDNPAKSHSEEDSSKQPNVVLPSESADPAFAYLLFLGEGGRLATRRQETPMWQSVGLEMRGHLARHITGHRLAKNRVSEETANKIRGRQSDAYMHDYRVISSEMAG